MALSHARNSHARNEVCAITAAEIECEREIDLNQSKLGISKVTADLMVQIFSSFDHPRDLVRCESVCKCWRLLIASSNLLWDNMLYMRPNDAQYVPTVKTKQSSKLLFLECYGIAEREEKKRLSQLHEWAGNLWHEFELGLSSCTS
jgi:hypothetical protein